jgi:pimeloyl-ACP methyl ester carboxylesterase
VPARTFTVRTADGVQLAAAEVGSGRRGVVLVHELGQRGLCGWWDYAAHLSSRGFHVLLFDHRCAGQSGCPAGASMDDALMSDIEAAVGQLRADGAVRVVLVGGSQGASEALIAASVAPHGVVGVVCLSADELTPPLAGPPYPHTAYAAAPKLGPPVHAYQALNSVQARPDDLGQHPLRGPHGSGLHVVPRVSGNGAVDDDPVALAEGLGDVLRQGLERLHRVADRLAIDPLAVAVCRRSLTGYRPA